MLVHISSGRLLQYSSRQASGHKWCYCHRKTHINYSWHHSMGCGLGLRGKEKVSRALVLITLGFLTVDTDMASYISPFFYKFLPVAEYTSKHWAEIHLSFLQLLFFQGILLRHQKKITNPEHSVTLHWVLSYRLGGGQEQWLRSYMHLLLI